MTGKPHGPEKAGIVVVARAGSTWQYLLLHARGEWDFPKGLIEPGEAPLDAALREVREETDIADLEFHWGYAWTETTPADARSVVRFYIAAASSTAVDLPISVELGHAEHDEFRWLDFDGAHRIVEPRSRPVIAWAECICKVAS